MSNPPVMPSQADPPTPTASASLALPPFRRAPQVNSAGSDRLRPLKTKGGWLSPAPGLNNSKQKTASSPKKPTSSKNSEEPLFAGVVPKELLQERRRQKQWLMQVRRMRLLLRFLFSLFLIAGLIACIFQVWQPIREKPVWIAKPQLVSPAIVEAILSQAEGKPLWLVNPKQLEADIVKQSPLIASAAVRRQGFPPKLMVAVTEQYPWAAWYEIPRNVSSKKGVTPKKSSLPLIKPQLTGLVLPSYEWVRVSATQKNVTNYIANPIYPLVSVIGLPHQHLSADQWQQLFKLSQKLLSLPELHVQALDIRQSGNVRILCQGPDVFIGPLNRTWPKRFERLAGVLSHLAKWSPIIEAVDLRWEEQVTLHKKTKQRLLPRDDATNPYQFQRP